MLVASLMGLLAFGRTQDPAEEPTPPLVVIIESSPEATGQIGAELRAVGFAVRREGAPSSGTSANVLEQCLVIHQPFACLLFRYVDDVATSYLAIARPGRPPDRLSVVARDSSSGALRDLALETAERLYARQMMVAVGGDSEIPDRALSPGPQPPNATPRESDARVDAPSRALGFSLHSGPATAASPGDLGLWLGASVTLALDLNPRFSIELESAGGGMLNPPRRRQGAARLGLGWVRSQFVWRPWGWFADRLAPFIVVGAGPWLVVAQGQGAVGYRGRTGARWLAAVTGKVGCSLALPKNWALRFDTAFSVIMPEFRLVFAGDTVARAGRPWVDWSLALGYRWGGAR